MTGAVVQIIVGLFLAMALPSLLRRRIHSRSMYRFVSIACLILGALIVIYGAVGLVTGLVPGRD